MITEKLFKSLLAKSEEPGGISPEFMLECLNEAVLDGVKKGLEAAATLIEGGTNPLAPLLGKSIRLLSPAEIAKEE